MSEGAQRRNATGQNARVRVDYSAVEVQKNGASHDPKIAAHSQQLQVRLVAFPISSLALTQRKRTCDFLRLNLNSSSEEKCDLATAQEHVRGGSDSVVHASTIDLARSA